jgi:hypothetical protein
MSLPAVLYNDRLEIGFTHSNQGNGSKARQLVDLNGSHRASQYTMGGTVNSKVNDVGLLALIGSVKTLVLEASAIENEADILANDNDIRLDIQLLEEFGADIVNVQDFAQNILAAEGNIVQPLSVEQIETLSKLIVDMAELRQMVLHADTPELQAVMQSRVEALIEEITQTVEAASSPALNAISQVLLSPAIVLSTLSMLQQSAQHFNVETQFMQRFEGVEAMANLRQSIEVTTAVQYETISTVIEAIQRALQTSDLNENARIELTAQIESLMLVQEGVMPLSVTVFDALQKFSIIESLTPAVNALLQANIKLNDALVKIENQSVEIAKTTLISAMAAEISPAIEVVRYAQKAVPISAEDIIRSAPINFTQTSEKTIPVISVPVIETLKQALPPLPTSAPAAEKAIPILVQKLDSNPPPTLIEALRIVADIKDRLEHLPNQDDPRYETLREALKQAEIEARENLQDEPNVKIDPSSKPSCHPDCDCFGPKNYIDPKNLDLINDEINKNGSKNVTTEMQSDGGVKITVILANGLEQTTNYTAEDVVENAIAVAAEVALIAEGGYPDNTTTVEYLQSLVDRDAGKLINPPSHKHGPNCGCFPNFNDAAVESKSGTVSLVSTLDITEFEAEVGVETELEKSLKQKKSKNDLASLFPAP